MNDYTLGAWGSLNYAIRVLGRLSKDDAVVELNNIKEVLEAASAEDYRLRLKAEAPTHN